MNYYLLRSLLASNKTSIPISTPSPSFGARGAERTYIETSYEKVIFSAERPTIVLLSAVGATGKSVLARKLSSDTQLPLLDLATHKPVGDHTLTGLLTAAYDVSQIGAVFQGLATGKFGIIIDGLDEGRSKTTEKAFDAFLDDVIKLTRSAAGTTILMLGRSQTVDECWTYFDDAGVSAGLITISPFNLDSAKQYIDTFTEGSDSAFPDQYRVVRDHIIESLGAAFSGEPEQARESFLFFIGYPPVLDAIVTLLTSERNYHKLLEDFTSAGSGDIELALLRRIADYILARERDLKVIPNIVKPLVDGAPAEIHGPSVDSAFSPEEQCVRLLAYVLGQQVAYPAIPDALLNERYEEQLESWIPEHPFLAGRTFRNAVFEAVVLANIIRLKNGDYGDLALRYAAASKSSYHLIYMLSREDAPSTILPEHLRLIVASALEFRSTRWGVEVTVSGEASEEGASSVSHQLLEIEVEVMLADQEEPSRAFRFTTEVDESTKLHLGSRLFATAISVPCEVELQGLPEVELGAPVEINARSIDLSCESLVTRSAPRSERNDVTLIADRFVSRARQVITNGADLAIAVGTLDGIAYPLIQYAQKQDRPPEDPYLKQKYLRARRILSEFRSHSRGSMARYKYKIESDRVIKNPIGKAVLRSLLSDGILRLEGKFFFLDADLLSSKMGVTWQDLRRGRAPEAMLNYLRQVK